MKAISPCTLLPFSVSNGTRLPCAFVPRAAIKPRNALLEEIPSPTCSDHKTMPLPQLAVSGHDAYDLEHNKSLLQESVDKSLLPWGVRDKQTRKAARERGRHRKAVRRKEMKQMLRVTPWQFRVMGNMIVSGTDKILLKEGRERNPVAKTSKRRCGSHLLVGKTNYSWERSAAKFIYNDRQ
jgi:hypothetical protein